jgi:hypothetical protein
LRDGVPALSGGDGGFKSHRFYKLCYQIKIFLLIIVDG